MKERARNLLATLAMLLLYSLRSPTAFAQGTSLIQVTNLSFSFYRVDTNRYYYQTRWRFLTNPFTWNPNVTPYSEPVPGCYTNISDQILFWDYSSNYDGGFEVASNSGSNLASNIWYFSGSTIDRPKWTRKNHWPITYGTFKFGWIDRHLMTFTTNVLTGVLPNVHTAMFQLTDGTIQTFYTNWPCPPMYLRCVLVCQKADDAADLNAGDELDINSIYDECANPYTVRNGSNDVAYLPNRMSPTNNLVIGGGGMVFGCGYVNGRIFCAYDGQPAAGGLLYGNGMDGNLNINGNVLEGVIFPVATDGQYYQNSFDSFSYYALKIYWY